MYTSRDQSLNAAFFLDTAGKDVYGLSDAKRKDVEPSTVLAADNKDWTCDDGGHIRGIGIDCEYYSSGAMAAPTDKADSDEPKEEE